MQDFSEFIRSRRSTRDFKSDPIPKELLDQVLEDAKWSPSWSNTHPYFLAVAQGEKLELIKKELLELFDIAYPAVVGGKWQKVKLFFTRPGWPDGDYRTYFKYPPRLQKFRVATGKAIYEFLGIKRDDAKGRELWWRHNYEFFNAPCAIFVFVHSKMREYSVLDAGIFLQSFMLSAEAHGLGTCAQGTLATWAGPIRKNFEIPEDYKLIVGVSVGYKSDAPINKFNAGRRDLDISF